MLSTKENFMRREAKVIKTTPDDEQNTITNWEAFGWELLSAQEIFSQDSHLEDGGDDDLVSVTETTNYIKLVFNRDTKIKNKEKLNALQREYEKIKLPVVPISYLIQGIFIAVSIIAFIVACILIHNSDAESLMGYTKFIFISMTKKTRLTIIIGIVLAVIDFIAYNIITGKKKEEANFQRSILMKEVTKKRQEIVAKARVLLEEGEQEKQPQTVNVV